jgi:hypothetical protein
MPTYCFRCECGKGFEEIREVARAGEPAWCECGKSADRDWQAEHAYCPNDKAWRNLLWSDACGVSSGGLAAAKAKNPDHIFRRTPEGTYQRGFKSARHRKQCLKSLGLVDRDSFI